jgi:hypothetical protein
MLQASAGFILARSKILSNDGAKLSCSTAHIAAFEFDLSLDGFRTTRHCHVVWRRGNVCGVEFVEQPAHPTKKQKSPADAMESASGVKGGMASL